MDSTATQMDPLSGFWSHLDIITTLVALPPCAEGQQPAQRVTNTTQNIRVCPLPPLEHNAYMILLLCPFSGIHARCPAVSIPAQLLLLHMHNDNQRLFCSLLLHWSTHHLILLNILGRTDGGAEARGAKQQKQTTTRIQLFQIKLQQTMRETKTESSSVTAMFPVLSSPARISTLCCSEQTGCTAMLTSKVNRFNTTVSYCRTFCSSAHLTASHGLMMMSSVSLLRKHLNWSFCETPEAGATSADSIIANE